MGELRMSSINKQLYHDYVDLLMHSGPKYFQDRISNLHERLSRFLIVTCISTLALWIWNLCID